MHPRDPARILALRFQLELALTSAPSLTGVQCEHLQERRGPPGDGARPDGLEGRRLAYAETLILSANLSTEEEHVCRLRYAGTILVHSDLSGTQLRLLVGDRGPFGIPVDIEEYERTVWRGDTHALELPGELPQVVTAQGEVAVSTKAAQQLPPGRVLVQGKRARWPTYEQISEALPLGLSPCQVQARIKSACAGVRAAMELRTGRRALDFFE